MKKGRKITLFSSAMLICNQSLFELYHPNDQRYRHFGMNWS